MLEDARTKYNVVLENEDNKFVKKINAIKSKYVSSSARPTDVSLSVHSGGGGGEVPHLHPIILPLLSGPL